MRLVGLFALFLLTSLSAAAQVQPPLPAGQVIDSVPCSADPTQSYALYLPSAYTPQKRWSIIYAFDPDASGKTPINLYKAVAEKYGFILAASNNSRNYSKSDSTKGAAAMWDDTHARFSIDEGRTYTTGFSGGARMAGYVATFCTPCRIAGVIASGAGYSSAGAPPPNLLYFLAVGDEDFNWPEVISIRRDREDKGLPYRVEVFSGTHQWAPAEVFEHAVEWLQLKAMQAGILAPDAAFIEDLYERTQNQADAAEKRGDAIAELSAERMLASDFSGLKDVAQFQTRLTSLKTSSGLKEALQKEQDQVTLQESLMAPISSQIASLARADGEQRVALRDQISDAMARLKDQSAHTKSEAARSVYGRALFGLFVQGMEAGAEQFESRHYASAEYYFQLMSSFSESPWPNLASAEVHTAMGNKKEALKDLRKAIQHGLKHPETLREDRDLQALQTDPEFQKIVAELKAKQK
jgi:dienelactone hydrolase